MSPSRHEDDKNLLWTRFSLDFDFSSFILSPDLFGAMNALSRGEVTAPQAKSLANEISEKMRGTYLISSVSVVMCGEERLLVITPQLTVLCAIAELLIISPNFPLLLVGLKSFAGVLGAIAAAEPRSINKRDFNTILVNQSGDGYSWIYRLSTNFLRIALSDSKSIIRAAGSQLIGQLVTLPGGARSVVRDLVGPILGRYGDDFETADMASARLRREAIDAVTAVLLMRPSKSINFFEIVDTVIVPGLKDPKASGIGDQSRLRCPRVGVQVDLLWNLESRKPLRHSHALNVLRHLLHDLANHGKVTPYQPSSTRKNRIN